MGAAELEDWQQHSLSPLQYKPLTLGSSTHPCDYSRLPGKKGWPVLRVASYRGDRDRSQSITN